MLKSMDHKIILASFPASVCKDLIRKENNKFFLYYSEATLIFVILSKVFVN
jgi:hypothetical protein